MTRHPVFLGLFLSLPCFLFTLQAQAEKVCSTINCDCASINSLVLARQCAAQQRRVLEQCVQQSVADTEAQGALVQAQSRQQWCTVHGLNAEPLALSTKNADINTPKSIKDEKKVVEGLFWSVSEDIHYFGQLKEGGDLASAQAVLKLALNHVNNLFEAQKRVERYWLERGKEKKQRAAWSKYASSNAELARDWQQLADGLIRSAETNTAEQKLQLRLYVLLGQVYESSAFAFEGAEDWQQAALAWQGAARASMDLSELLLSLGLTDEKIIPYRDLSAARLYRASAVSLKFDKTEQAQRLAAQADRFILSPEQQPQVQAQLSLQAEQALPATSLAVAD
ncbi:hypothetical protein [Agaribacterium haliotis]|uniref:hypothetical protein n=1 Tax=Agaribacterium haliotis TaxID=2013869 RepID=UPI000BB58CF6|nr:hypothetical protein [Agaribacterium haliotis]